MSEHDEDKHADCAIWVPRVDLCTSLSEVDRLAMDYLYDKHHCLWQAMVMQKEAIRCERRLRQRDEVDGIVSALKRGAMH